jgi:hypothetical protein
MVAAKKKSKKSAKSPKIEKHMFKYAVFVGVSAASRFALGGSVRARSWIERIERKSGKKNKREVNER